MGNYYPPFEFCEYFDEIYTPQAKDDKVEILHEDFLLLLKENYPEFSWLFSRYDIKFYWGDSVTSISTISFINSEVNFHFNSKLRTDFGRLKPEEINLLLYLLFIHAGMELCLRKCYNMNKRDINTELISFFKVAEAYYKMDIKDKQCLKGIEFQKICNRKRTLLEFISYLDSHNNKTIKSVFSRNEVLNYLLEDQTLKKEDYTEQKVKRIIYQSSSNSVMNQRIIQNFMFFIQKVNRYSIYVGILAMIIAIILAILQNRSIFDSLLTLFEISLLTIIITIKIYNYYLTKFFSQTNLYQRTDCPWESVIDDTVKDKLGNPGDDEFCRAIPCPLFQHEGELCKIRKKN